MKKVRVNDRVQNKYDLACLIDRICYCYAVVMYNHNTYEDYRNLLRAAVAKYPERVADLKIENL